MKMMTPLVRAGAAMALLLGCGSVLAAGWTLTELPPLGGAGSAADAINASGHVVGYAEGADGVPYPVVWKRGVPTQLSLRPGRALAIAPAGAAAGNVMSADGQRLAATLMAGGADLELGTLGGSFANVLAVNDAGQVAGTARTVDELDHAFVSQGGSLVDLGTYGGAYSYAYGMNRDGVVVGAAWEAAGTARCFITSGGGLFDPGTLGGSFCNARAVNDAGQVTGNAATAAGIGHAFVYDAARGMVDLGTLGGSASLGLAINRHGQVAGSARTAANQTHAFLHDGTRMIDLGTLGGALSVATGLNALGQVVGYATTASGSRQPFLWSGGAMLNLNTLVPGLTGIDPNRLAINDAGQIAGTGLVNGQPRGFVLTPPRAWRTR